MSSFVADEDIPFMTISAPREAGHTVLSIREEYQGLDDIDILKLADDLPAVVTNDRDFGEIIFRYKVLFSAGLIFFRANHFKAGELAAVILHRIKE